MTHLLNDYNGMGAAADLMFIRNTRIIKEIKAQSISSNTMVMDK